MKKEDRILTDEELRTEVNSSQKRTRLIAEAALLAALCYIGFQFFRIDIPVGPEKTAFHFGNVFCMLAALLIGGWWGGLAGGIGMGIADLTSGYAASAIPTFILKLGIGLVVGFLAHRVFHLNEEKEKTAILWKSAVASAGGALFNLIFDPLIRYFYKLYILGLPQEWAKALAKMGALTTLVNGIVAVVASSLIYLAVRPALRGSLVTSKEKA